MAEGSRPLADVAAFLADHHRGPVEDLTALGGGFWSAAYGYRFGGRELVARFGGTSESFEFDRAAMAFAGPTLPIPEVLAIEPAFDGWFACSVRHQGQFLEDLPEARAEAGGRALAGLLTALRRVPAPPGAPCAWHPAGADPARSTFRSWLLAGLADDHGGVVSGWRSAVAADGDADRVFRAAEAKVRDLLEAVPERRDLVHSDLLHQNVLVDDDWSRVSAVFSWKCSLRGDFLYDTAWCTFWSAWHPGIAAADMWRRTVTAADLTDADLADAAVRHHCYELQIGASHLGWYAWTEDPVNLAKAARETAVILDRGPLGAN